MIKLFGLYSLILFISSGLAANLHFFSYSIDGELDFTIIFGLIGITALMVAFMILLVYKCDLIIEWLKLDKGFDEERIDFGNLNNENIIKVSAVIIGAALIVKGIPPFLNEAVIWLKAKNTGAPRSADDRFSWSISAINLLIGYLLLTTFKFIPGLLKMKNSNEEKSA